MHPMTGQSLHGEGCDELGGGRRRSDVDFAPPNEKAGNFSALVGSYAAGYAEQDALVREA